MSHCAFRKGGIIPIEADVALTQGQLVKLSGSNVIVNTAANEPFGVATEAAEAGSIASIAIAGAVNGTVLLEASAAIALGAKVKPAANGQVTSATTGILIARALEAATAAGDRIECALLTPVTVA
jgi:hypothetical protein